jgi:hypothetical protein
MVENQGCTARVHFLLFSGKALQAVVLFGESILENMKTLGRVLSSTEAH